MATAIKSYNPGFLTDEELRAMFCVRVGEFESLLETLRENTGESNQHAIVVGPRGSGKTTLLLRVALEVRSDPELSSRLYPIVFAEESYSVSTCGEFWLECLSRLAQQEPHRAGNPDLRRTVEDLRRERDDRVLRERCLGALLDLAEREGKRLVLHVENLNMLFSDMMDPDAEWCLRKTLQTEPANHDDRERDEPIRGNRPSPTGRSTTSFGYSLCGRWIGRKVPCSVRRCPGERSTREWSVAFRS